MHIVTNLLALCHMLLCIITSIKSEYSYALNLTLFMPALLENVTVTTLMTLTHPLRSWLLCLSTRSLYPQPTSSPYPQPPLRPAFMPIDLQFLPLEL